MFVSQLPPDHQIREIEFWQAADQQSGVVRTRARARSAERRVVAAVVERTKRG
jgi:hypothetical protein